MLKDEIDNDSTEIINPMDESFPIEFYPGIQNALNSTVNISGRTPVRFPIPNEQKSKPSFFSNFGHVAAEYNDFTQAISISSKVIQRLNSLNDEVPEGWDPIRYESVEGYAPKYWSYLISAKSPKDLLARQQAIQEQMKEDELYASGGWLSSLLGGAVGIATSPSTYFLPNIVGLKTANFSKGLIHAFTKAVPAAGLATIAIDGKYEAARAGSNIEDFVQKSMVDTAFASALIVGGTGLGVGFRANKLWDTRRAANYSYEGVNINPVLDKAGNIVKYKAEAAPGYDVSAAKVREAQSFVDSQFDKSGFFAIPGIGFGLEKIARNKYLGSPIVRGLTSTYKSINEITNRFASHGLYTSGEQAGKARADSAEDILRFYQAQGTAFVNQFNGLFFEANGIKGGNTALNAAKNFKQHLTQNGSITREEFSREVHNVITTGVPSKSAPANEAATLLTDLLEGINTEWEKVYGWKFATPRNALNYVMQAYDVDAVLVNKPKFIQTVFDEYSAQDKIIRDLNAPIESIESQLKVVNQRLETELLDSEVALLHKEKKTLLKNLRAEERKLTDELTNNPDYHILLENRLFLDNAEKKQIRDLLKPQETLLKEIEPLKVQLREVKEKISNKTSLLREAKHKETRLKNKKIIDDLNAQKKELDSKIRELEDKLFEERVKIDDLIQNKEISSKLYRLDEKLDKLVLRNHNERPLLRKPFVSDRALLEEAEQIHSHITGTSETQLIDEVLGGYGGFADNPQYTKARRLMIPANIMNDAGFLAKDLGEATARYISSMGRHLSLRQAFNAEPGRHPLDRYLKAFAQEAKERSDQINLIKDDKKRATAIRRHDKLYQEEKEFIEELKDIWTRSYDRAKWAKGSKAFTNISSALLLGGVPISQINDLGAIVLKHGPAKLMVDGLKPLIKSVNARLLGMKGAEAKAFKQNAASAYVGLQHVSTAIQSKILATNAADVPLYGRLGSAIDVGARLSGNLYGTNYIENINQSMVANIFQSEIMQAAFAQIEGKITQKQIAKMNHYGIDIKKEASRFVKNYKEANGWEELGGYQSKYYDWLDAEAGNLVARATQRAVYDTIVQGGLFTSPLWANHPVGRLISLFHGWAYGAFVRYTVPTLQRFDAQAVLGNMVMLGLGIMEEPLRQWANGKEVNWDDDYLILKGLDNSGILSITSDMAMAINLMLGNRAIPSLKNERHREITVAGALFGPAGGIVQNATTILGDLWTGEISQDTVKKSARMIPLANHLLFRRQVNKFIEGSGLPEKRKDANPYSFWEYLD